MFCITGIFKCFTPHEDARRVAPRRAASRLRHAPVHQLLLYPDIFYFLTSLPILSLSLFLFSASNEHSQLSCLFRRFFLSPFVSFSIPNFSRCVDKAAKCVAAIAARAGQKSVITEAKSHFGVFFVAITRTLAANVELSFVTYLSLSSRAFLIGLFLLRMHLHRCTV